jgi:hypothetical protein
MKNLSEPKNSKAALRPLTKKELANLYQVSPYVLRKWFMQHPELQNQKRQKIFSIKEVEKIFEVLGTPDCFILKMAA